MSDPTPASPEKTITVDRSQLCRLRTLTYLNLTLSALIVIALLACAVIHHHQLKQLRAAGRENWGGGRFQEQGRMGGGPGFQRFGGNFGPGQGQRWGNQGDFGGGPGMMRGPGPMNGGPGGDGPGRPAMGGGFGMSGMMGGSSGNPPDPAKMTDHILGMLTQKLTLTDDQKAKLKPIILDQVTQLQKQMEAQRQAMQKQIEDAKAQIKPLLNADQQKQLDALPLPGQKSPPPEAK